MEKYQKKINVQSQDFTKKQGFTKASLNPNFTLIYLLKNKNQMLQFSLLKFLRFGDLGKFESVCTDCSKLVDSNKKQNQITEKIQIKTIGNYQFATYTQITPKTQRYLLSIQAIQYYSKQIKQENEKENIDKVRVKNFRQLLEDVEEFGINDVEFKNIFEYDPLFSLRELKVRYFLKAQSTFQSYKQYADLRIKLQEIKKKNMKCKLVWRLNEKQLAKGQNLEENGLRIEFLKEIGKYQEILVVIKSHKKKVFACNIHGTLSSGVVDYFKMPFTMISTNTKDIFNLYFSEEGTVKVIDQFLQENFMSTADFLIRSSSLQILCDRNQSDQAILTKMFYKVEKIKKNDGYPHKDEDDNVYLAGGCGSQFRALGIEVFSIQ